MDTSTLPRLRTKSSGWVLLTEAEAKQAAADEAFLRAIDDGNAVAVAAADRPTVDDLNIADEYQNSAVHKSMRHRDLSILKFLVEKGAYVCYPDRHGARPIAHAIREDNVEAIGYLLSLKHPDGAPLIDLLDPIGSSGNSLIHEAAWYDRVDCAKVLLESGAFTHEELSKQNNAGQTAMHVASFRATPAFIQLLVEYGASVDAATTNPRCFKETPQQLAQGMGKAANVKHLQDLSVALASIRFAARLRKRSPLPPPVLHIKFEYDLQFFSADLEKSFLAQLAMHAGTPPETLHVLSRTAGSVVLEVEVRTSAAQKVLARIEESSLEALSQALGYPVLSRSIGPRSAAPPTNKGTPHFRPLDLVMGSPRQTT